MQLQTVELQPIPPRLIATDPRQPLGPHTIAKTSPKVLHCELEDGRVIVLMPHGDLCVTLSRLGSRLWKSLSSPKRLADLGFVLALGGDRIPSQRILEWTEEMTGYGLLELDPQSPTGSRRLPVAELGRVAHAHKLARRPVLGG